MVHVDDGRRVGGHDGRDGAAFAAVHGAAPTVFATSSEGDLVAVGRDLGPGVQGIELPSGLEGRELLLHVVGREVVTVPILVTRRLTIVVALADGVGAGDRGGARPSSPKGSGPGTATGTAPGVEEAPRTRPDAP